MRTADLGMPGGLGVAADEQFFKQFLARPQAGECQLDVAFGIVCIPHREAREMDHEACQVLNAHRVAHVEQVDRARLGRIGRHGGGLNHQLGCFGNGHEIARDVGMGHRDRPATLDLLPELGDHAARRAQHVAKANHGKARGSACGQPFASQCLHHHFSQSFGGPHHVGGAHGFVGADEHHVLNPGTQGGPGHIQRAQHIVANGGHRVVFHQGHMLVRCRVVHGVGPVRLHQLGHAVFIAHIGEQGSQLQRGGFVVGGLPQAFQVFHNRVQRIFVEFDEHQLGGVLRHDLAAQFAANGAARAGNHDGLAGDVTGHQLRVWWHRVAPQQVFQRHLAQLVGVYPAVGQIGQPGQGAHPDAGAVEQFHDLGAACPRYRGQRQQHVAHAVDLHLGFDRRRVVDQLAHDAPALQAWVVV